MSVSTTNPTPSATPSIVGGVTIADAHARYRVEVMRTRFGTVECFVKDAEAVDDVTGGPATVMQGSFNECVDWLDERGVHVGQDWTDIKLLVQRAEESK